MALVTVNTVNIFHSKRVACVVIRQYTTLKNIMKNHDNLCIKSEETEREKKIKIKTDKKKI